MAASGIFAQSGTAGSVTAIGGVGVTGSALVSTADNAFRALVADITNNIVTRGSDVASATTLDLDSATTPSLTHNVTGTTTTTAITLTSGQWRILRAVGAWPLTAGASLIINGSTSVSYTCTAEDILLVQGFAAGVVRVTVLKSVSGTKGTVTNDSAAAGYVGEYVESNVAFGSPVSLTSGVAADITSISLTAGDWDVTITGAFIPAATTSVTSYYTSISLVSATIDFTFGRFGGTQFAAQVPSNSSTAFSTTVRLSLASTTTVRLVSFSTFTISTMGGYGIISARRVR